MYKPVLLLYRREKKCLVLLPLQMAVWHWRFVATAPWWESRHSFARPFASWVMRNSDSAYPPLTVSWHCYGARVLMRSKVESTPTELCLKQLWRQVLLSACRAQSTQQPCGTGLLMPCEWGQRFFTTVSSRSVLCVHTHPLSVMLVNEKGGGSLCFALTPKYLCPSQVQYSKCVPSCWL